MAWDFGAEIHALSGFDADDGSGTTISGEFYTAHANQWLTDGAKEVISNLPMKLKEKCMAITALTDANGTDLDGFGEVMFVSRETGDATTIYAPCREIPSMYGGMAGDSSSLLYYGTATDPVFWVDGTGDASKLYVKPDPTGSSDAKIFHISYPTVTYSESTITNFPDEAEHLVVLYAAIRATEHMMLDEEDQEVYAPQLATLKQDYAQGLAAIKGGE